MHRVLDNQAKARLGLSLIDSTPQILILLSSNIYRQYTLSMSLSVYSNVVSSVYFVTGQG